jgi:hypothetical protein
MGTLKAEFLKQKKILIPACIIFPIFINVLLYFTLDFRYWDYLVWQQERWGLSNWQLVFQDQGIFYFPELCHIVAAVLVYQSFAIEKEGNAWMIVMSSPYKKGKVILGKYAVCLISMLILFVVNFITIALDGFLIGVPDPFETGLFIRVFLAQFLVSGFMIALFIFLGTILRKIVYLIPIAIICAFLTASWYSRDFIPYCPFTYGTYGYLATNAEMIIIIAVLLLLGSAFLCVSCFTAKRKDSMH